MNPIAPFAIFALVAALPTVASAGAKVYLGVEVPAASRVSLDKIDHSAWSSLLAKYVDSAGRVNYSDWKKSRDDTDRLHGYLRTLSAGDLADSSSEAKIAFWVNAYNAVTIAGILREYPTTSIRNHTSRFFGYNIWHDLLLKVSGAEYSLDAIEHKILRKTDEPRIHFAIVCASISCPRLRNEAYTAAKLDRQLTDNAVHFFAQKENFVYDQRSNTFRLSSILSWFAEDFGANKSQQLKTIARWLPTPAARQAAVAGSPSITYLSYDWDLNERK